jgi:phosphate/phosphite/phosphonate ABC transporter binding protein
MTGRYRALLGVCVLVLCLMPGCGDEPTGKFTQGAKLKEKELVRISGSSSVYPIAKILSSQCEKLHPDYRMVFSPPTHSRGGIAGVSLGEAHIGLISRPLTPKEKVLGLTYFHLAEDILAFATHRGVPFNNLSSQQLLDIYAGKITNWKEVGGPDATIVVLDRPEHTSPKIALRHQLFGHSLTITSNATILERPEDAITSLNIVENSIAYISLGQSVMENLNANILAIDWVEPSLRNFQKGLYPYYRAFGFVVGTKPSKATMQFVNFAYSEEGQQIMVGHGFSPITMDLIVAVQPEQDLLAQEKRYAPLVKYLRRKLGLMTTVKLKLVPSYIKAIKEFKAGRVNAAFLGSLAFGLAHAQVGVEPLVRPEKDGISQYKGLIVARKDSGIKGWEDLKGKSFGMVDKATTAGYIFPLIYFREHGVEKPEEYLGSIVFTGSHDLLFLKVYKGELDAGAAKDLMLWEVAKTNPRITEELHIIATSAPVPNNTFVVSDKLDWPCLRCHKLVPTSPMAKSIPREPMEFNELLSELLLNLQNAPEGRRVLDALGADRFVKTTREDLQEVNKMLYQAGFDPKNYNP